MFPIIKMLLFNRLFVFHRNIITRYTLIYINSILLIVAATIQQHSSPWWRWSAVMFCLTKKRFQEIFLTCDQILSNESIREIFSILVVVLSPFLNLHYNLLLLFLQVLKVVFRQVVSILKRNSKKKKKILTEDILPSFYRMLWSTIYFLCFCFNFVLLISINGYFLTVTDWWIWFWKYYLH